MESEKIAEKRYTAIPKDLNSKLSFKNQIKVSSLPREPKFFVKKAKININNFQILKMPLTAIILASFFLACFFVIFSINRFSIKNIKFHQTSDVKNAMREYLFPDSAMPLNKNNITEIPDFVSIVTFKNYTVGKGDTISGIAYKFGLKKMGTILAVNDITNAKRLFPGQKLIIPSIDGLFHTVKSGENLSGIAKKYELQITALLDANDLSDATVKPGQKIFIPGASMSTFSLRKALGELFIYPIRGRLTSGFGYRRDPFTGFRSFHTGVDLAARKGTPVKSVLDGRISEIGYSRVYGNYVIITHAGGYQSFYAHLSKVYVKRRQTVSQGSRVAAVGNTGRSTGAHLHLSIYKNGKLINPLSVLTK